MMSSLANEFISNDDLKEKKIEDVMLLNVLMLKQQNQDFRLDEFSADLNDMNFKVNNLIQNGYNYYQKPKDTDYVLGMDDDILKISVESRIIQDIICEVEKFKNCDDIQDQIAISACISEKCLKLLKIMKRSGDDNQRKSTVHLFFQAIKRNYAKSLFNGEQVDLMKLMLVESQNDYISESKYFDFDEKLYQVNLSVFPEEE